MAVARAARVARGRERTLYYTYAFTLGARAAAGRASLVALELLEAAQQRVVLLVRVRVRVRVRVGVRVRVRVRLKVRVR